MHQLHGRRRGRKLDRSVVVTPSRGRCQHSAPMPPRRKLCPKPAGGARRQPPKHPLPATVSVRPQPAARGHPRRVCCCCCFASTTTMLGTGTSTEGPAMRTVGTNKSPPCTPGGGQGVGDATPHRVQLDQVRRKHGRPPAAKLGQCRPKQRAQGYHAKAAVRGHAHRVEV